VRRYVAQAIEPSRRELAEQLSQSASRALAVFAGAMPAAPGKPAGGLQAISDFMEANVPEAERSRAGEVLIRILNGTLFELVQLTRENAGLKPLEQDDRTRAFMTQAVLSLSDAVMYPARALCLRVGEG
jgi:cytochrome c biogenesis protein